MLESLIETHGYWAGLKGTFFEGETVLLLGSFAASRGYLVLRWVIVVAFLGILCAEPVLTLTIVHSALPPVPCLLKIY